MQGNVEEEEGKGRDRNAEEEENGTKKWDEWDATQPGLQPDKKGKRDADVGLRNETAKQLQIDCVSS